MKPVLAAVWVFLLASGCAMTERKPFQLQEATVASIHNAFASGELTCVQLTQLYLDRIAAYDRKGPTLRAILTVNPRALEIAAEMDRQYRADPAKVGRLHCIPTILKDNFNTADMPTTAGSVSMKSSVPPADAFTVTRMRNAGVLILAKANLQEFARGGMSVSSLGGQVLNPYDLTRTPGGSSGGTGTILNTARKTLITTKMRSRSGSSPASSSSDPATASARLLAGPAGGVS